MFVCFVGFLSFNCCPIDPILLTTTITVNQYDYDASDRTYNSSYLDKHGLVICMSQEADFNQNQ